MIGSQQHSSSRGGRTAVYMSGFLAVIAMLAFGAAPARAQQGVSGSIFGTVTDSSGGALPGVTVTLKSPAIQAPELVEVTQADGSFRFLQLSNGVYQISYQLSGFTTVVRSEQQLPSGMNMRLDASLTVGGIEQSVEVSAAAPVVDTRTTSTTNVLTASTIQNTPVGRGLWELLSMTPGINVSAKPDVGDSEMGNRSDIVTYGVVSNNTIAVEGVNTSLGASSAVYQLSFSVDEVNIKTTGQSADIQGGGMNFQAVLKSGSNKLRGNYAYSVESPRLQSSNVTAADRAAGLAPNPLVSYYDFGLDLGGPILKDKLWYYVAYARQARDSKVLGWTDTRLSPTRGPDGKFFTTVQDAAPNNLKQVSTRSLKMSYQLSPKNRVIFVAQPTLKYEPQRNGSLGQGTSITRPLQATVNYHDPGFTYKGEVQTMFNSKTLLDVNLGRGGYQTHYSANDAGYGKQGFPSITDSTINYALGPSSSTSFANTYQWNVGGSLSMFPDRGLPFLPGKHELKVGGQFLRNVGGSTNENNAWPLQGNYDIASAWCLVDATNGNVPQFTTTAATGALAPTCGAAQANRPGAMPFIMNRITFRSAYENKSITYGDQISAYFTDAWRISRRFTFNWGVRYDRQHPWVPAQSNPAMSANDDLSGLFKGGSYVKQDGFALYSNIVPRLAAVWDLDGKGRNVVKGSYSLYTGTSTSTTGYSLNGGKTATFNFRDLDGNRDYTPGIGEVLLSQYTPGCLGLRPTTCPDVSAEPSTSNLPATSPKQNGVKAPVEQEIALSFEREVVHDLGVRFLFVNKSSFSAQTNITPGRPYSVWNRQITRRDPGPDGLLSTADDPLVNGAPRMVTFFDYDPAFRDASFAVTQLVNVPRSRSGQSYTYELAMTKRLSHKWSATMSGWITQIHNPRTTLIQTPNDEIFPDSDYSQWAANVTAAYQAPLGILVSMFYQAKECLPSSSGGSSCKGTRTYAFAQADPDGGPSLPSSTTITIPMEPAYQNSGKSNHTVNLRGSKQFKFRKTMNVNVDFDTFNLFNAGTPTAITYAAGVTWGRVTEKMDARIARIGLRFGF
jgi:Carboxypeptidase regulatory-like domain